MHNRGFTIFFAILVASLALAVGFAIYDIVTRELVLSQVTTQSQHAIFAADAGAECALYWDSKYGGSGFTSVFVAPASITNPGSGVRCNGQDIFNSGTPPATYVAPPTGWTTWAQASSTSGTMTVDTTFTVDFATSSAETVRRCAVIDIHKEGNPPRTTIVSRGYNDCRATGSARVERLLQVSY